MRYSNGLLLLAFNLAFVFLTLAACGGGSKIADTQGVPQVNQEDTRDSPPHGILLEVLRDTSGLPKGVRLSWEFQTQEGVTGYYIYRGIEPLTAAFITKRVNDVPTDGGVGALAVYDDYFNVKIGDTYFYVITAVDAEGDESPISENMSIIISMHSITGLVPGSGGAGSSVRVDGVNFGEYSSATDEVFFWGITGGEGTSTATEGSIPASVIDWDYAAIIVSVPDRATFGPVEVVIDRTGADSPVPFQSTDPYLLSASPDPVLVSDGLTLIGKNFGALGGGRVHIGDLVVEDPGFFTFWSDAEITFIVPYGLVGPTAVWVEVDGVGATNFLTVDVDVLPPPSILSVNPQKASPGQEVVLTGSGFSDTPETLNFNGVIIDGASPDLVSWTDSEVRITIPATSEQTGRAWVERLDGKVSNFFFYRLSVAGDVGFVDESFIAAGEMSGLGTDASVGGGFLHIFTLGPNLNSVLYDRKNLGTGTIQHFDLFENSFLSLTTGTAAVYALDGTLWVAFVGDGHVYVSNSSDVGQTWSNPQQITSVAGNIGWLAADDDETGNILLAWGNLTDGNVYFAYFDSGIPVPDWVVETIASGYTGGEVDVELWYSGIFSPPPGDAPPPAFVEGAFVSWYDQTNDIVQVWQNDSGTWFDIGPIEDNGGIQHELLLIYGSYPGVVYHNSTTDELRITIDINGWVGEVVANGFGNGIDAYSDGTSTISIATGDFASDPSLIVYDLSKSAGTTYTLNDLSNSEDEYPALAVVPNGNTFSVHTDTGTWDHWLVTWDTSGGGNPTEQNLGDGFGRIVPMGGDDHIAGDMLGGTGFLFRDATSITLYLGYYYDGVLDYYVLDTGTQGDFNVAGLDAIDTIYHIFYQKGLDLMYTTFDASTGVQGSINPVSTFGVGVYNDIAVLGGSAAGTILNALFIREGSGAGTFFDLVVLQSLGGGSWSEEIIFTLGESTLLAIDLAMDPDGESLLLVYYDNFVSTLLYARGGGGFWQFFTAQVTSQAGQNLVTEYYTGTGLEMVAFNGSAQTIEQLIENAPNWIQDTMSAQADINTPYDLYGGTLPYAAGADWGLYNVFIDAGNLKYSIRDEGGSYFTDFVPHIEPTDPIGYISHVVDEFGGLTVIYSGNQDYGLYLARQQFGAI